MRRWNLWEFLGFKGSSGSSKIETAAGALRVGKDSACAGRARQQALPNVSNGAIQEKPLGVQSPLDPEADILTTTRGFLQLDFEI